MVVTTGRGREPRPGQGEEVEMIVDQIELIGVLEDLRDVEAFLDFGVELVVFLIATGDHRVKRGGGQRVRRGEQGDV